MDRMYKITTDNTADLPYSFYKENDIDFLFLPYTLEDKQYTLENELPVAEFYDRMRNGSMPTTSQYNAEDAAGLWEPYLKQGVDILHIAFSSGLSGSYNSARLAAEDMREKYPERKITVVDSLSASLGEGMLVWYAAKLKKEGKTMEEIMENDPVNMEKYMEQFVDLQLTMHAKKAPRLTLQKDKFARKIETLKETVDATTRYELQTRLDSMPKHTKLCHGDFNPSNVIVAEDGTMTIVDWSHATQGNASGDAAITYLQFALKNQKLADLYLDLFCKKSDTAKQYVQKWLPIAAAVQLTKGIEEEKAFLSRWIDVIDFQ